MLPACEDAHHMWIVTQQSYIIRPFTSSLSLAGTPADAPTCSAAANGNSRLGTTLLAPSGESWPKAAASFLRGQGYKTVSRFSLFKNNWPLRPFLFTRRPPPRDTGGRGGGVRRCGGGLEGRKEGEGEKHIWDCNSEIPFTSTRKAKLHIRWIYWKRRHYEKRQIITEWRTYLPKITLCLKHRHTTQRGGEIWAQT